MAPREDSASKSQLTRSPKDAQALNGDGNHSNETNDKEEEQQTQTKSDWRAFLRQPLSVALVAILAGLMILYIDPPWLSSLDMRSRIPPPHYWLLDTTTAYHITPNRFDFCAYHSLAQRLHSSLLPPLTLSTPDDPSYEDDGADSSSYDPFTLYHLGHRVLGYGTVRLAVPWPADSNYSLAPPAHTFSKLNYTILTNVLYIPTAQEPSISVARLVTDSSNLVRIVTGASNGNDVTEKALELVIFSSDGALSFMKPDKTRIRNGRYLVRAWAWKNWNVSVSLSIFLSRVATQIILPNLRDPAERRLRQIDEPDGMTNGCF